MLQQDQTDRKIRGDTALGHLYDTAVAVLPSSVEMVTKLSFMNIMYHRHISYFVMMLGGISNSIVYLNEQYFGTTKRIKD